MTVQRIPLAAVTVGSRLRRLDEARIGMLAASIAEIGLRTPITVAPTQVIVDASPADAWLLVAGHHRLEAARRLGHADIDAFIADADALDRELWEIDENLMRAELNELAQAEHLARRKEIYEARHPETRAGVAGGKARQHSATDNLSFADDAAAKLGIDERTVQRAIRRARKIATDVKESIAGGAIADSGVELDALASLSADEQRRALRLIDSGKAASVREAKQRLNAAATPAEPLSDAELRRRWLVQGMTWWNRGNAEWREGFLAAVEQPVFDKAERQ